MTSACLDVSGTAAGGVTLNPVVLGTISGSSVLLKTRNEIIGKKSSYVVLLTHHMKKYWSICDPLWDKSCDDQNYLTQLRVPDDIVIDMCPLVDKWDKEYSQKFISEWSPLFYPLSVN